MKNFQTFSSVENKLQTPNRLNVAGGSASIGGGSIGTVREVAQGEGGEQVMR